MSEQLLLFYTRTTRLSSDVLGEQCNNITANRQRLDLIRDMATEMRECLLGGQLDGVGELLHRNWELKKELGSRITNGAIDALYDRALSAGASGGKIVGAGGGGFLLLYCDLERQKCLRARFQQTGELPFDFEGAGSRVIFNRRRHSWK